MIEKRVWKLDVHQYVFSFLRTIVFYLILPYSWMLAFEPRITTAFDAALYLMLVVNLDSYGQATAGSRILWLPEESDPLSISLDEKCTILAQVIKQLGLTPVDLLRFVGG